MKPIVRNPDGGRTCGQCGEDKPLGEFLWKVPGKRLTVRCHTCRRLHYKQDPHRARQRARDYYHANKEHVMKAGREHRETNVEQCLWMGARRRARTANLEFNIEPWEVCVPKWCPVLGIPLEVNRGHMGGNSPTLDRIDTKEGYIHGNVIVVSARVNTAKSDLTLRELRRIVKFYTELLRERGSSQ